MEEVGVLKVMASLIFFSVYSLSLLYVQSHIYLDASSIYGVFTELACDCFNLLSETLLKRRKLNQS